jgi:hypothetical protein
MFTGHFQRIRILYVLVCWCANWCSAENRINWNCTTRKITTFFWNLIGQSVSRSVGKLLLVLASTVIFGNGPCRNSWPHFCSLQVCLRFEKGLPLRGEEGSVFLSTARVFSCDSPEKAAQWMGRSIRESWGVLWLVIRLFSVQADVSSSVKSILSCTVNLKILTLGDVFECIILYLLYRPKSGTCLYELFWSQRPRKSPPAVMP